MSLLTLLNPSDLNTPLWKPSGVKQLSTLNDSAQTIVYRMVVGQLKNDPVLSSLGIAWMTYLGETQQQLPYTASSYPAVQILPFGLPASPEAQVLQNSPLSFEIVVTTPGLDVRDLLNLWGAIEHALFPGDGSKTLNSLIRSVLTSAAASYGYQLGTLTTINLTQPLVKPGPSGAESASFLTCIGYITAMMVVPK